MCSAYCDLCGAGNKKERRRKASGVLFYFQQNLIILCADFCYFGKQDFIAWFIGDIVDITVADDAIPVNYKYRPL